MVSGLDEPRIIAKVMRHGAAGFAQKSADKATLISTIAAVLRGELAFPRSVRYAADWWASKELQFATRIDQQRRRNRACW